MKFLRKLKNWNDLADYPADSDIYSEGDPAEKLYVIISGEVELTLGEDLLSSETTGGIIGEMAILEDAKQGATASTLNDVRAARFNREQLKAFMIEDPEFSLHLMSSLAKRLRLVDEYITTDFTQDK